MTTKKSLSRITIDISKGDHKRLKTIAAVLGKSMRIIVIDALEEYFCKAECNMGSTFKNIEKDKTL